MEKMWTQNYELLSYIYVIHNWIIKMGLNGCYASKINRRQKNRQCKSISCASIIVVVTTIVLLFPVFSTTGERHCAWSCLVFHLRPYQFHHIRGRISISFSKYGLIVLTTHSTEQTIYIRAFLILIMFQLLVTIATQFSGIEVFETGYN